MELRKRAPNLNHFCDPKLYNAERRTDLPLRIALEGLWCCCDRQGVFEWRPVELKSLVLPFDEDVDMDKVLLVLKTTGYIERFVHNDVPYGFIPSFTKEAKPSKTEEPEYPPPAAKNAQKSPEIAPEPIEQVLLDLGDEVRQKPAKRAKWGKDVTVTDPEPAKPSWSKQAVQIWIDRFGHCPNAGQIVRFVRPLVVKFGEDAALGNWRKYLDKKDPEFASPADYAKRYNLWAEGRAQQNGNGRKGAPETFNYTPSTNAPKELDENG